MHVIIKLKNKLTGGKYETGRNSVSNSQRKKHKTGVGTLVMMMMFITIFAGD